MTDEELMENYLEGDDSAFRQLFERYASKLERLFRREVSGDEKVRELVQQTFLQFHRARADFDRDQKVRPWLFTIAMNLRRDYLRKASTHREIPTEELPEQSDRKTHAEELAEKEGVKKALAQLSTKKREVVELHWFDDLKYQEVAEVLDISESAAKTRAHRAYKKMRNYLKSN